MYKLFCYSKIFVVNVIGTSQWRLRGAIPAGCPRQRAASRLQLGPAHGCLQSS